MGARAKEYVTNLGKSMNKADSDVMRCNQFMIGIDANRSDMEGALVAIQTKMTAAPTQTFSQHAAADPDLKKLGERYQRAATELEDYKTKFTKTIGEAAFSVGQAEVVAGQFEKYCAEKASKWNPLKKKSLKKSTDALNKAKTDLANLHKLLDGVIDLQKAKGNIA